MTPTLPLETMQDIVRRLEHHSIEDITIGLQELFKRFNIGVTYYGPHAYLGSYGDTWTLHLPPERRRGVMSIFNGKEEILPPSMTLIGAVVKYYVLCQEMSLKELEQEFESLIAEL